MTNKDLLKEALELVYYFNTSEPIRQEIVSRMFDRGAYHKGIPFFNYIQLSIQALVSSSPTYFSQYIRLIKAPYVTARYLRRDPSAIEKFLEYCYQQNREFSKLNTLITLPQDSPEPLNDRQLRDLERLRNLPPSPNKETSLAQFIQSYENYQANKEKSYQSQVELVKKVLEDKDGKYEFSKYKLNLDPKTIDSLIKKSNNDTVQLVSNLDTLNKYIAQQNTPGAEVVFNPELVSKAIQQRQEQRSLEESVQGELQQNSAVTVRQIQIPEPIKKFTKDTISKTEIFINRKLDPAVLGSIAAGAVGLIIGFPLGGIQGAVLGAGSGVAGAIAIKNGALGNLLNRSSFGGNTVPSYQTTPSSPTGLISWVVSPQKRLVLILAPLIIIMPILLILINNSSILDPFGLSPTLTEGAPISNNPTSGGDIAQCTFYRSGDGQGKTDGGIKFNIPQWPALISEVANKVGLPSSVLAAFLRIECTSCFATTNPAYITNDYDPHYSTVDGQPFAYGVMQFYPPTFQSTFSSNQAEISQSFGKTSVRTTIDPQSSPAANNILRIYSIRDSLIAAGYKIKKASGGSYNKSGVEKAVRDYFTLCEYTQGTGTYNYCDDVYKSVSSCQPTSPTLSPAPLPNGDLRIAIQNTFGINFVGPRFTEKELSWAWEALSKAKAKSPRFYLLLQDVITSKTNKYLLVVHSNNSAETFNSEDPIRINIRDSSGGPFTTKELFQQILVHELGHIIHGISGSPRDSRYDSGLRQAQTFEGTLTRKSEVNIDEAFSEVLSYYLLPDIHEQPTLDYARRPDINPLDIKGVDGGLKYSQHLQFIKGILNP